jgi:dTMP kinase
MKQGLFITFEGGEGSGKTTQSRLLFDWLKEQGKDVVLTREPGGTKLGEELRKLALDPTIDLNPKTQLMLHIAARIEHVETVILPALAQGQIVICDRYLDSTVAYQHYGHGIDKDLILEIHKKWLHNLMPDKTFLLSSNLKTQETRIKDKQADRYESLPEEFHTNVLKGFHQIAVQDRVRFVSIDGSMSIQDIHEIIVTEVKKLIHQ